MLNPEIVLYAVGSLIGIGVAAGLVVVAILFVRNLFVRNLFK